MNAMMKTDTAVNKVGIINTPNQPMYNLFSVEVTHSQKRAHSEVDSRLSKIAVIKKINCKKYRDFSQIKTVSL